MEPWVGPLTGNEEFPVVTANAQGVNYRVALSQITPSTLGFGSMALQNSNAVQITGGNVAVTTLSGAITIANGGTGVTSTPTAGQLLIGNGTGYTIATLTAGSGVSITNGAGAITISATNSGTVTSVGLSGGTTGITVSGANPITSSGTFTLGGVLNIANGGTGATTAAGARTAFGAAASGANSDITSLSGLTTPLSPAQGGTGAAASLSGYVVANGSSAYTSVLTIPVSDLTGTLPVNKGGTGATTAAGARVNLLNSYSGNAGRVLAVNSSGTDTEWISVAGAGTVTSVDVSGGTTGLTTSGGPITAAGTITLGGTLAVANGGTGATTAADARTNLSAAKSGANTDITSVALTTGTVSTTPSGANDIANKTYVDNLVTSGISYHTPVKYEVPNSTGNLNALYNQPGGPGVGVNATLTNNGTLAAFAPDGPTAQVGDRILIYNQTNAFENGVYTVTTVGSGSVAWVLTRATDADSYGLKDPDALGNGDAFFITSGNTGAGETYVCNTPGTITFGTTAISFTQVSSAQVYSAGTGLTLTGTVFSLTAPVATSLGGTGLTSFTSGGAVYATSTSALTTGTLPVTAGGTGATSLTSGYLVKGNGTSAVSASVVYDDGTNVGIGTTIPPYRLTVVGSDTTNALISGTTKGVRFAFNSSTSRVEGVDSTGAASYQPLDINGSIVTTSISGTEKMRLDASGNLGLGTASPSAKLDVAGTGYFSDNVTLSRTNTAGSLSGMTITNAGTTSAYAGININSGTVTSQFFNDAAGNAVVAGAILRTTTNHPLVFGTNATERMRISSGGSVSIGTTSVLGSALLSVAGKTQADAAVAGDVIANYNNSSATGYGVRIGGGASGAGYALSVNNYAGTELMQVTGAGNVGIGTSGPTEKLVLNSGSAVQTATKYINTNTTGVTIGAAADGSAFVYQASALPFIVYTNASEKFRIASSGAIGLSGANYGSAGQVLTSNGSGSAPTWQPASGGLSRAQVTAISMILGF